MKIMMNHVKDTSINTSYAKYLPRFSTTLTIVIVIVSVIASISFAPHVTTAKTYTGNDRLQPAVSAPDKVQWTVQTVFKKKVTIATQSFFNKKATFKNKLAVKKKATFNKKALFKNDVEVVGNLILANPLAAGDITGVLPATDLLGGTNITVTKNSDNTWTIASTAYSAGDGITLTDNEFSAVLGTLITSSEIENGTITASDIASETITTSNILNGTIAISDLATNLIDTTANADIIIADGSIPGDKLEEGTIVGRKLVNAATLGASGGLLGKKYAMVYYDAGTNGGDIGTISDISAGSVGFPDNTLITNVYYKVTATFTSATDAATLSFGIGSAGNLNAAIAINNVANPWDDTGVWKQFTPDGEFANYIDITTGSKTVQVDVANEDLILGEMVILIEYYTYYDPT